MKIAITCADNSLDCAIDPRFGRCAGFLVFDTDSGSYEWKSNEQNLELAQGAGIQAGMNVAETGAKAVITGHVGPKAYKTLNAGQIDIYLKEGGTVAEAIEDFRNGRLSKAAEADKPGHW